MLSLCVHSKLSKLCCLRCLHIFTFFLSNFIVTATIKFKLISLDIILKMINLGDIFPDFHADTTIGPIDFHNWLGDS